MIDNFFKNFYKFLLFFSDKIRASQMLQFLMLAIIALTVYLAAGFSYLILVLLGFVAVSFRYPFWGTIVLSLFIPFKYFFKTISFIDDQLLTMFIPIILLSCFLGSLEKVRKISETEKILFLIFLSIIVSSAGSVIVYGWRNAIVLDIFIWLQLIGFFLIGKMTLSKEGYFKKFVFFNLGIANAISAIAIFMFLGASGYSVWIESYELITARATSTLGNPNALAGYLLLITVASIFMFIKNKIDVKNYLAFLLPLVAFILTFSRGAWITAVLVVLAYFILNRKYNFIFYFLAALLILFTVSPVVIKKRVTNIWSGEHASFSSDSGRIWAVKNVFYINRNHLLFGNGMGSYGGEYAYSSASPAYKEGVQGGVVGVGNTDNQLLQVYAQQGVVGLWLYSILFYYLIKKNRKSIMVYPIIAYLVLGIFVDTFQFYQISFFGWVYTGLMSETDFS